MQLQTTTDLLIGQWATAPRLEAAIEAPLDVLRDEVCVALTALDRMREIDNAEGVWLDYLGVRVGIRRPSTTDPAADLRWGLEGPPQSRGFDQVPFAGDEVNAAVYPLPDAVFRRFVRARVVLIFGDGTAQTFARGVQEIDPDAILVDNRDMTVDVTTLYVEVLELADSTGALPRSAGVTVTYATP